MLSQDSKDVIEIAVEADRVIGDSDSQGFQFLIKSGMTPRQIIETQMLGGAKAMSAEDAAMLKNTRENIKEAAQYFAGLLGLC